VYRYWTVEAKTSERNLTQTLANITLTGIDLHNTSEAVYLSARLVNAGGVDALRVYVTELTFSTGARLSPPVLPMFLPNLKVGGRTTCVGRFKASASAAGTTGNLSIRGVYRLNASDPASEQPFGIDRLVTVPAAAAFPTPLLRATVRTAVNSSHWGYTLFNLEPSGSPLHLSAFSLSVAAPVLVTGTPAGWAHATDGQTYVYWYSPEAALPYPSHVRPGQSLSGFSIQAGSTKSEATPFLLTSWNHTSDEAGEILPDMAASPHRP
jgi:hypothetical protein